MIKFLAKNRRNLSIFGAFISLAAVSLGSCTQVDNTLGEDLIDPSMRDSVKIDSSFSISAFTVSGTKIPGLFQESGWLGSYTDPTFGNIEATMAVEYYPSSLAEYKKLAFNFSDIYNKLGDKTTFLSAAKIDSLVMQFMLSSGVGDSLATQTLNVYQTQAKIHNSLRYYTNSTLQDSVNRAATISKVPVSYNRQTNRNIRVHLTGDFIKQLTTNIDTTKIEDYEDFIDKFFPLFLENVRKTSGGSLNRLNFSTDSSYIKLYYRIPKKVTTSQDSTIILKFNIGSSRKINFIAHKHNNISSVRTTVPANATGDLVTYVQGLGGMRTLIRFDEASVANWANTNRNIHRAELIVAIPDGPIDYYRLPAALTPYYKYTEPQTGKDTIRFVADMYSFLGIKDNAFFNRSKRSYSINVTSFFKDAMRGTKPKELYLYAGYPSGLSSSTTNVADSTLTGEYWGYPSQARLGSQAKPKPFKLVITYSK